MQDWQEKSSLKGEPWWKGTTSRMTIEKAVESLAEHLKDKEWLGGVMGVDDKIQVFILAKPSPPYYPWQSDLSYKQDLPKVWEGFKVHSLCTAITAGPYYPNENKQ